MRQQETKDSAAQGRLVLGHRPGVRGITLGLMVGLTLGWLSPSLALAGAEQHDGFFVRLGGGMGVASAKGNPETGKDVLLRGSGLYYGIAVGAVVIENLALHLDLSGTLVGNPDRQIDGETHTLADDRFVTSGVGAGATYYFMPSNTYVSGSLVRAAMSLVDDRGTQVGQIDGATGLHLAVGREWWIQADWGIGVGGSLLVGSVDRSRSGEPDVEWGFSSMSLYFSATYN